MMVKVKVRVRIRIQERARSCYHARVTAVEILENQVSLRVWMVNEYTSIEVYI